MPVGRHFQAGFVAAVLTLAMLIGGCGDDDGGDRTASDAVAGGLAAGLDGVRVPATDDPLSLTWADTARLREASGISPDAEDAFRNSRWSIPVSFALGDPVGNLIFAQELGFDPMTGDRTVGVGIAPDRATLYANVDTGAAEEAFGDLGYDEMGGFLAEGEEGGILPGSPSLTGINRIAIDGSDLALGAFEEPVAAAIGREGEALSSVEGIAAASDCLGSDALVAQVDDPGEGAAEEVALQAVGVTTPGEDDVVPEVLCAVGSPGESLGGVADCMEGNFNDGGIDPFSNRPYEDELGEAEVTEGGVGGTAWVRATFEPPAKDPIGILFNLAAKASLVGPLGGEPIGATAGPTVTPEQIEALEEQLPDVC